MKPMGQGRPGVTPGKLCKVYLLCVLTGMPPRGRIVCVEGRCEHRQGLAAICGTAQNPAGNLLTKAAHPPFRCHPGDMRRFLNNDQQTDTLPIP